MLEAEGWMFWWTVDQSRCDQGYFELLIEVGCWKMGIWSTVNQGLSLFGTLSVVAETAMPEDAR